MVCPGLPLCVCMCVCIDMLTHSLTHSLLCMSVCVYSTSISEDLGQIEYVLTDKTGTLTENRMEFKKCIVGTKVYGGLSVHGSAFDGLILLLLLSPLSSYICLLVMSVCRHLSI